MHPKVQYDETMTENICSRKDKIEIRYLDMCCSNHYLHGEKAFDIDRLMQNSANALELRLFCIKPSICSYQQHHIRPIRIHITLGHADQPPHYNDVKMGAIASQITSVKMVYSTVYSGADQRKHQSSASLAGDRWIPRSKGQQRGKCLHLMTSSWSWWLQIHYSITLIALRHTDIALRSLKQIIFGRSRGLRSATRWFLRYLWVSFVTAITSDYPPPAWYSLRIPRK